MSVEALGWAFHQKLPGNEKLLLLAIANHADPCGIAYVGQERLAETCGVGVRALRDSMHKLVDRGLVDRRKRFTKQGHRTSDWLLLDASDRGGMRPLSESSFPIPPPADSAGGRPASRPPAVERTDHRQPTAAEPSVEPSVEPSDGGSARARARQISFRGKPVKKDAWNLTEKVLVEFNTQTDRKLRLLTSAGQPSEAAKRIYGRVVDYPDIPLEKHADIIRRTLASRWWGADEPSIGVVYGPNVFEENITRPGIPRSGARREQRQAMLETIDGLARGDFGE